MTRFTPSASAWRERAAIIRLAKALETIAEQELANSIVVVESRRIRMRRLPVQRKPENRTR
jgi:hypothetical protein